jgi:hypothetical protein
VNDGDTRPRNPNALTEITQTNLKSRNHTGLKKIKILKKTLKWIEKIKTEKEEVVNWEWSYNLEKDRGGERNSQELNKASIEWMSKALRWKRYGEEPNKDLKWLWLKLTADLRWRKFWLRLNSEESKSNKALRWRKLRLSEPIEVEEGFRGTDWVNKALRWRKLRLSVDFEVEEGLKERKGCAWEFEVIEKDWVSDGENNAFGEQN